MSVTVNGIIVKKRDADWMAYRENDSEIWGCGKTQNDAVGDLVASHPETFDIEVTKEEYAMPGKKTRSKGKAEPMKRAMFHLTPDQFAWLRSRPGEGSDNVRLAVDILRNWFDICGVTGSVTPKSVVVRMCPDRVLIDELERRLRRPGRLLDPAKLSAG